MRLGEGLPFWSASQWRPIAMKMITEVFGWVWHVRSALAMVPIYVIIIPLVVLEALEGWFRGKGKRLH